MTFTINPAVAANFKKLADSMLKRESITIVQDTNCSHCGNWTGLDKDHGIVNDIQAEDGSGINFNITLHTGKTIFVKLDKPGCIAYDVF